MSTATLKLYLHLVLIPKLSPFMVQGVRESISEGSIDYLAEESVE